MDVENQNVTAPVTVADSEENVPKKSLSYWARTGQKYRAVWMALCLVLAVFLIVFTAVSSHVFGYHSLFYFARDLRMVISLADLGEQALYYDYRGELSSVAVYRGGVAVAHQRGLDIYGGRGERLLSHLTEASLSAPRLAVSRNCLALFDFGGTSFLVCNSYDVLFEGKTEQPIYGVFVSEVGFVTVVTGSSSALSEVLLYNANFQLVSRFSRASATIGAAVSDNGRTVALVGATAKGAVVDVYAVGKTEPMSETVLAGFPLAMGYTAENKLAVITDEAVFALSTKGKLYGSVNFEGGLPTAYSIDENGVAVSLETDRLQAMHRVLVLSKKGSVEADFVTEYAIKALSQSDHTVWLLGSDRAVCAARNGGETVATTDASADAVGIVALHDRAARVLYPAEALTFVAE